jgi:hypothetical protein
MDCMSNPGCKAAILAADAGGLPIHVYEKNDLKSPNTGQTDGYWLGAQGTPGSLQGSHVYFDRSNYRDYEAKYGRIVTTTIVLAHEFGHADFNNLANQGRVPYSLGLHNVHALAYENAARRAIHNGGFAPNHP